MLHITSEDPTTDDAAALLRELTAILHAITGDGGASSFDPGDLHDPGSCFVVARDDDGTALGCGALRPMDAAVAELKRMFARPGRTGVGRQVLAHLEAQAVRLGYHTLRLSTRIVNARAVRFYERAGYVRIAGFGKYAGSTVSVCFEKTLV